MSEIVGESSVMAANRTEFGKMIAEFKGPVISFSVEEPWYLGSCDACGWVGSTEQCPHSEEDAICPRCHSSGVDCGKVAEALSALSTPIKDMGS